MATLSFEVNNQSGSPKTYALLLEPPKANVQLTAVVLSTAQVGPQGGASLYTQKGRYVVALGNLNGNKFNIYDSRLGNSFTVGFQVGRLVFANTPPGGGGGDSVQIKADESVDPAQVKSGNFIVGYGPIDPKGSNPQLVALLSPARDQQYDLPSTGVYWIVAGNFQRGQAGPFNDLLRSGQSVRINTGQYPQTTFKVVQDPSGRLTLQG